MDATYLQRFLTSSARGAKRNEIRELLKLVARPNVISLAGGLPSPDTFPLEDLTTLLPRVIRRYGRKGLQYGPTEGDRGLRDELIRLMEEQEGFDDLSADHVLVTTASQQGLDLCARTFIQPGDVVVCGLPSYLGALGAFSSCGARLAGVPVDEEGMRPDLLEEKLVELRRTHVRPKFLYVVPDFQNPAGVTLSHARRLELLAIARDFDTLVLEDSPYRQLRYEGESIPSLFELDRDGRVIALFSFSKVLSPGLRLGWLVAEPSIVSALCVAKQPVDLCTSPLTQIIVREFLRAGLLNEQIRRAREQYAEKLRLFLSALEEHIDPAWGVRWTRPEGGLFVWMTLPPYLRSAELLEAALQQDVAFVAGSAFHCDESGANTLRLNFSYPSSEQLNEGAKRLGRALGVLVEKSEVAVGCAAAEAADSPRAAVSEGDHALTHLPWNLALSEFVE